MTVVVTNTPTPTPFGGYSGGTGGGSSVNYQSNGNTVKGSNAKDMPKTGMADVKRMLAVIILITLGCIQLVTTIPIKKK